MARLVFATRSKGKLAELRELTATLGVDVIGVDELPGVPEVEEDGDTFVANARKKAIEVAQASGLPALADDSGLEVDALGGAPGVISARYAGVHGDDAANNAKLLAALAGVPAAQRTARFRCVLAFVPAPGAAPVDVAGSCDGVILETARGDGGFGYDPLFFCPELGQTFAEAGVGPKSGVSHRARAMAKLLPVLAAHFAVAPGEQQR